MTEPVEMEAFKLSSGAWVVRPEGSVGTCGWHPSAWEAVIIPATDARSAEEAIYAAGSVAVQRAAILAAAKAEAEDWPDAVALVAEAVEGWADRASLGDSMEHAIKAEAIRQAWQRILRG